MSCNGCRILRKGCNEDCILRPCLSWIPSPESQANATLFLAKFYGRAGLFNLIKAGPPDLRSDIFKSLLHEACGRVINPTYGSIGLMWSGNWDQCQAAVESVLHGSTTMQLPNDDAAAMPLEGCDIRHKSRNPSDTENRRVKMRNKFKRPRTGGPVSTIRQVSNAGGGVGEPEVTRAVSHESLSVENVEGTLVNGDDDESAMVNLELTLG